MVHYNENIVKNGRPVELSLNSAGSHHILLKSLLGLVRMAAQSKDYREDDGENIAVVADFIIDILPGESHLEYGIESEEQWFKKWHMNNASAKK
jgi:hypothetical protein